MIAIKLPKPPSAAFLKTLGAAVIAAAIMHILVTLAAPGFNTTTAYQRLAARMPANKLIVLAPAAPNTQVLPFQAPDLRMAICRFDASDGPVTLRAPLPEPGWTLALYGPNGETFYAMTAQEQRRTEVALVLIPPGDRFTPAINDARAAGAAHVQLPSRTGLAVIRAPNSGRAFAGSVDRELASASCASSKG